MKAFIILLATTALSAQASYNSTKCTNADASISWELSPETRTLTIKDSYLVSGVVQIPFDDLKISFGKKSILKDELLQFCGYATYDKVYSAKISVTSSEEKPESLKQAGLPSIIDTEVICHEHSSGRADCP